MKQKATMIFYRIRGGVEKRMKFFIATGIAAAIAVPAENYRCITANTVSSVAVANI